MSDVKDGTAVRKTLKLNTATPRAVPAAKAVPGTGNTVTPAARVFPSKGTPKTSAAGDWAAEYKRRMQADMDALSGDGKK